MLRTLMVTCVLPPGGLSKLAKALAGGACPLLERFHFDAAECNEDDLDSIAGMLEVRALIPGCKKLRELEGLDNDEWFYSATLETKIRLLRALLPVSKTLPTFTWEEDFEACFLEASAPYLTTFDVWLQDGREVFTWNVLKAVPALVRFDIGCAGQAPIGAAALQSITTALQNGSLPNLQEVVLRYCDLSGGSVQDLAIALAGSGCAKRVTCLKFIHCGIDSDGVRALADMFSQGTFPALSTLDLSANHELTDGGVVALAEALLKATQTFLTHLILPDVGMGDEGIAALGSLVFQGRMEQLEELSLSRNDDVTKQGIIALAEAIDNRGLPKLRALNMGGLVRETDNETVVGITTLVHAISKGCPPLEEFIFDPAHRDVITSILKAAGWPGEVNMC